MRQNHKWTLPELRQIQAAADAGRTRQQAADELGMSLSVVMGACYRHGIRFARRPKPPSNVAHWDRATSVWTDGQSP